ncbi:nucleoside hydrolase [Bacillus sp. SG-1]|uniref:nucleoside hydrolase n=1 Tax=Bacillus sp. SG-1 TaxID=161544 RepID=UPI0001543B37|nr:nucleoside hydrolase [Bacillus sp. SG-1]EDL66013.1 inosine-uridine preferring nucleoside hydrolase family protein [Bacillus sp. SG-1]
MPKKKVLLFSDFGVDDVIAVLYALYTEEIEIVGIVADYGNVSKQTALQNVKFLQSLTETSRPIIGGAVAPLTGDLPEYFPEIHGIAGLGPIIPENHASDESFMENFFEVKAMITKYQQDITIYSAGRLTSLATAFILYPETMKLVKDIYIMGGAFGVPGNVTPVAEANIYGDPYAANIVLKLSPKPAYIIPLDVTKYAIFTPEMINDLDLYFKQTGDKVGEIIKPLVDYYQKFYKKTYPDIQGSPLHDLLAMWALKPDSEIEYVQVPVSIEVNIGNTFGQSSGDFRAIAEKEDWRVHNVAVNFNYRNFIEDVYGAFKNPPKR